MKASKIICLLLALSLCAALFAACSKPEPTESTAPTETTGDETTAAVDPSDINNEANRVPASFVGTYVSGRCTITAEAVGDTDMKFTVHWGSSAAETRVWEMSGTFQAETLNVPFTDCVCKDVTYNEDGSVTNETVQYENGTGSIQFYDFTSLCWTDDQDHAASGMTFTKNETADEPAEEDSNLIPYEDRVPAKLAGVYGKDRCSIEVIAASDTELSFKVTWSSSAAEYRIWEATGTFDADTMRVNYTGCVCKDVTFGADGEIAEETVVYEDGYGRFQFSGTTALLWMDEVDNAADGMTFEKTITP